MEVLANLELNRRKSRRGGKRRRGGGSRERRQGGRAVRLKIAWSREGEGERAMERAGRREIEVRSSEELGRVEEGGREVVGVGRSVESRRRRVRAVGRRRRGEESLRRRRRRSERDGGRGLEGEEAGVQGIEVRGARARGVNSAAERNETRLGRAQRRAAEVVHWQARFLVFKFKVSRCQSL